MIKIKSTIMILMMTTTNKIEIIIPILVLKVLSNLQFEDIYLLPFHKILNPINRSILGKAVSISSFFFLENIYSAYLIICHILYFPNMIDVSYDKQVINHFNVCLINSRNFKFSINQFLIFFRKTATILSLVFQMQIIGNFFGQKSPDCYSLFFGEFWDFP